MLLLRQLKPGSPQAQLAGPCQGSIPASLRQSLPALPEHSAVSSMPPAWLSRQFPSWQKPHYFWCCYPWLDLPSPDVNWSTQIPCKLQGAHRTQH